MGGLFIAVVLVFPRGLAGLVTDQILPKASTEARAGLGAPLRVSPARLPAE